jgi:hypothetical protein
MAILQVRRELAAPCGSELKLARSDTIEPRANISPA